MRMRAQIVLWLLLACGTHAVRAQEYVLEPTAANAYLDEASFDAGPAWSLFGGGDFLLVKPRFSEAVAFAEGNQTLTTHDVRARAIEFDYEAGLRVYGGIQWGPAAEMLTFTYTHMQGDSTATGSFQGAGHFIVDPFGNYVGAPAVVDPSDARFPGPLPFAGDAIRTTTSVDLNVYDVDFAKQWFGEKWSFQADVGARIADVDQYYESVITNTGIPISTGTFAATFVGAGPRLGLQGTGYGGQYRQWNLNAAVHTSLLLGDQETRFTNTVALPFAGTQSNTQSRMIPVTEIELSMDYRPSEVLKFSAGWFFHHWYDLGASGGTFGGFFTGADDANSMSFDGLFLRAEWGR